MNNFLLKSMDIDEILTSIAILQSYHGRWNKMENSINTSSSFSLVDVLDCGAVHIANKSPAFDVLQIRDPGVVHIANKSPAFDLSDVRDLGVVHVANKSPAFKVAA